MKNIQTETLIVGLKRLAIEQECGLWKRVASDLEKPGRRRRLVNVYKIEQCAKDGETIIVPGKVLGDGELSKKVTVAAFAFSDDARAKIGRIGKTVTVEELMRQNPKGKDVRILG